MKLTKLQERILILVVIVIFTLFLVLIENKNVTNVVLEIKEENNSYLIRNVGDTIINVTVQKKEFSWVPIGAAVLDVNESALVEKANIKIFGQQHD